MTNRHGSVSALTKAGLIAVRWPAPSRVRSFCSTRIGGTSKAPFAALNLSTANGDSPRRVTENILRLCHTAQLPHRPHWPRQVHGARAIEADTISDDTEADAVFTTHRGRLCSVRTADCLPVLLCDQGATTVAAAHAGWRGLAAGVLEATIDAMPCRAGQVLAWLGPAIGPQVYEIGAEVRAAFVDHDPRAAVAFRPSRATGSTALQAESHWLADLYELARQRLRARGVAAIYGGGLCTFSEPARFFSYRRDGLTGRMASGIWLADD